MCEKDPCSLFFSQTLWIVECRELYVQVFQCIMYSERILNQGAHSLFLTAASAKM